MDVIQFAFALIIVVINVIIIKYLISLESMGCECAMDWRRNYIMFYFVLSLVYAISTPFLDKGDIPLIQSLLVILGVINTIFILQYVHRLYKEKCACSQSLARDLMTVIALVNLLVYVVILIYIMKMGYSIMSYSRNKKIPPKMLSIRPRK